MQKKIIITITIISLVLGMMLPVQAYGSGDIGYEGRICRDLGILKGDTGVVDSAYLETRPSRLQAAIMFLRLKGLEQEALRYTGGNNFKDAASISWKEGRNVLSYLKDHPGLGWIGDGVNFLPYNLIDSRAYYKVLLESLGYKQKIDGDGDFDWNSVLAFAETKGLKKVADTKNFTVESLAIATVEALKTKMKNDDRKLIEYLVDIGDVDKDDARDLDLYTKELKAEIKTVRAISNSKVEVVFEEPVNRSEAADEDLYTIKQLDIKSISTKNESAIIINTSVMNESTTYTLNFDDNSYSFKGLKKDTYAPKLITAECKDTDLVELTFDRVLDDETAQDTDTYSIEGVGIRSAELDSTNTKVRLTTSGIESGRSYEIKIRGMKNADGVTTKLITKRFAGRKDITAPKLNKLTVLNNVKLLLEFSDSNGIDKALAQDVDNYRIISNSGGLDVKTAVVKDRDDDGLWDTVELVTESQNSGKEYTLIIDEMADDSVLRNRTAREIKREFRGKSIDKSGPTVARNPKAVTNTMVEIEFSDSNALDVETACDIGNYEIDGDLDIIEARIKDPDNLYSAEGRTVLLITGEMEKSESYNLKIFSMQDEFGNEMKTSGSPKNYRFRGVAEDRTPPYITFVECIDNRTIELNFDNLLDEKSAETVGNYRLDGLALATKAVLQEDGKTVRLTVSSLSSDRNHSVLLNNIEDLSGNAMSNVSVSVLYNGNLYDDDPPEVEYIEAVNYKEVWIHFDEEVYTENAEMEASGIRFEQVGSVLDDGTTVVMKALSSMDDDEYEVSSLKRIWDLRNNAYELEGGLEFYGTDIENDPPEVEYWDQMDVRRFRVVFSEPVLPVKDKEVSGIKNPSGVGIEWKAVLNPDGEDTNEAYSTVDYISQNKNIPIDKVFRYNFTVMVADYANLGARDEDDYDYGTSGSTAIESYLEDDEDPYIEYVEALTQKKAQIVFSEAMREAGRYKITYEDENDKLRTIEIELTEMDSKDSTRVNLYTKDVMSDEYYYTLEPLSAAVDIAGRKLDINDLEVEFEGTNIMSSDYIQGVEILNANTLRVSKSSNIYKVNSLYELDENGNTQGANLIDNISKVSDNVYKVISKKSLLKDIRYEITVDGLKYKFYGDIDNGGLKLELPEREIRYDNMDMDKQYVEVLRADGEKLSVEEKSSHFEIDDSMILNNGEILYIYVKRESDGIVLFGAKIKVEGMLKASSSKEITSFSLGGKDIEVSGSIDKEDNIINLKVPFGTDLNDMVANFKCSDNATVKIGSVTQVSGETANDFIKEVTYTVIAQDGSEKHYNIRIAILESKYDKKITSFAFRGLEPDVTGEIDQNNHVITLVAPYGTDLKDLEPAIEISPDTTVYPKSGEGNDFSEPVIYKVTAKDGSAQNYTVKVAVASEIVKRIERFSFEQFKPDIDGSIDEKSSTINVVVPYDADMKELVPTIATSDNTEISPEAGKPYDFRESVKFEVRAADGTTREYKVNVSKALNSGNSINGFSFRSFDPDVEGNINEELKTIELTVPYGTPLNNLKASFTVSPEAVVKVGDVVQQSGDTENDFTKPVTYTVIAQDDSTQDYIVKVTAAPSGEKQVKEFGFTNPKAIGVIDETAKTISIKVPYGTVLNGLKPVFASSSDSKVFVGSEEQKSGETLKDFINPVKYSVVAQDGSKQDYIVTVTAASENEKYMSEFAFNTLKPAVKGTIDKQNHTIKLTVPKGTELNNLAAYFQYFGKTVEAKGVEGSEWIPQTSGVTPNDFSKDVIYRITAPDGTTLEYTVTVTVSAGGE